MSTRLAWLLVRVAFDAEQTRSLVTNILGRQPGVTPDILQTILEGSQGSRMRGCDPLRGSVPKKSRPAQPRFF